MDRLKNKKVIHCMSVLRKKITGKGQFIRYKAKLVIFGNQDHDTVAHTFAPVVYLTVALLFLVVASERGWLINQVDYSNAFLQGELD